MEENDIDKIYASAQEDLNCVVQGLLKTANIWKLKSPAFTSETDNPNTTKYQL